jgi:hypothetical protein
LNFKIIAEFSDKQGAGLNYLLPDDELPPLLLLLLPPLLPLLLLPLLPLLLLLLGLLYEPDEPLLLGLL